MNPALRGCRKQWVHLGTQRRLPPGGTPREREGLLGGGLLGGGLQGGTPPSVRPSTRFPYRGPFLCCRRTAFRRSGVRGGAPPPERGVGLTGRGGAGWGRTPRWSDLLVVPGRGGASPTPGTRRRRGGGGAAARVTSLRPPPPRRLLFPFPN